MELTNKQIIDNYNRSLIKRQEDIIENIINSVFKDNELYDINIGIIIKDFCISKQTVDVIFTKKNIIEFEKQKNYLLKDLDGIYLIRHLLYYEVDIDENLLHKYHLFIKDNNGTLINWLCSIKYKHLSNIINKFKFTKEDFLTINKENLPANPKKEYSLFYLLYINNYKHLANVMLELGFTKEDLFNRNKEGHLFKPKKECSLFYQLCLNNYEHLLNIITEFKFTKEDFLFRNKENCPIETDKTCLAFCLLCLSNYSKLENLVNKLTFINKDFLVRNKDNLLFKLKENFFNKLKKGLITEFMETRDSFYLTCLLNYDYLTTIIIELNFSEEDFSGRTRLYLLDVLHDDISNRTEEDCSLFYQLSLNKYKYLTNIITELKFTRKDLITTNKKGHLIKTDEFYKLTFEEFRRPKVDGNNSLFYYLCYYQCDSLINIIFELKFTKDDLLVKDVHNSSAFYWLCFDKFKDLRTIIIKLKFTKYDLLINDTDGHHAFYWLCVYKFDDLPAIKRELKFTKEDSARNVR